VAVLPSRAAVRSLDTALAPVRELSGAPHWVPPERWHITLAFLGEVDADLVDRLATTIGTSLTSVGGTPTICLVGAGAFPDRGAPRVLWAGVDGDTQRLSSLARRVRAAARRARVAVPRAPFRPHLTVGRWRDGDPADRSLAERLAEHRGPSFAVRRVALIRSHLGPRPAYEVLCSFAVRAGD